MFAAVADVGAPLGRKTYLSDMANSDNRAAYVALSNLVGGAIGVIADGLGIRYVILALAAIALFGAMSPWRLEEIS